MKRSLLFVCTAGIGVLCGCGTGLTQVKANASAGSDAGDDIIELSADDLGHEGLQELLGARITIASGIEEELAMAPSSVTVFTYSEIRALGITSLDELINHVPGLQVTRDVERGTASRISARGRGSALSEYVLVLIDGQRLNDVYTGGISLINRQVNLENVRQVEIIRGPGSALYGSNAFLAVINIVTTVERNNVAARAGTLNTREGAVNVSYGNEDGLQVAAFAGAFSDEGQEYAPMTDIYNQMRTTRDPRSGTDLYATVSYKDLSLRMRHMERRFTDFIPLGIVQWNSGDEVTTQTSISTSYRRELASRTQFTATVHYSQERQQLSVMAPPGIPITPEFTTTEPTIAGPTIDSFTGGIEAGFLFRLSAANQLHFGASYAQQTITDIKLVGNRDIVSGELTENGQIEEFPGPVTFDGERRRHIVGIYLQDKQSFGKSLDITAGMRLDVYNDFGISFNPRAAIVYKTPIDSIAKVIYGRAFRAPNSLELYEMSPLLLGNPDLNAEQIDTIEVAYSQSIKSLNLTGTFFFNSILNEIVAVESGVESSTLENQDGRAASQGVELELAAYPISGLALRASYTHLINNPDSAVMSTDFASMMVSYRKGPLSLGGSALFRGAVPILRNQDEYLLLDAQMAIAINERLQLTGSVHNILDTSYKTITTVLDDGVLNRGRVIRLGFVAEY